MILYRLLERVGFRPLVKRLYRIELAGAERIPPSGPCILVANHESLVDPFILGVATQRPIRWMAKAELWRYPGLRSLLEAFGTFPVTRGRGDEQAIGRAVELLEQGELLGIFPQGTALPFRHRPFHRGAARLALQTGAPIVPVCLVGTEKILRPHRPKVGLPKVRILVAPALRVARQQPTVAAAARLTRSVEQAIAELRRPYGPPAHVWLDA